MSDLVKVTKDGNTEIRQIDRVESHILYDGIVVSGLTYPVLDDFEHAVHTMSGDIIVFDGVRGIE